MAKENGTPGAARKPLPPDLAPWKRHLVRAADICGGYASLDRACGFARNKCYRLREDYENLSAEAALAISRATGGKVKVRQLMPEVAAVILSQVDRRPRKPKEAQAA